MEYETDARGVPVTRWDGRTMKRHPATGEPVPDDTARIPIERYVNARAASWPRVEFIVGNPPFIGNKRMRDELGDGYVEAVRKALPAVPDSADFVMYWWHKAAGLSASGEARRFGLITTNSITMAFNRRIVEAAFAAKPPVSLTFAVDDHPWVDASGGADVRIAMTVGVAGAASGTLLRVVDESEGADGVVDVRVEARRGNIHADLTIGADLASARALRANELVANRGVIPHGAGFIVTPDEARDLGLGTVPGLDERIRPYRNGKDLADRPRGVLAIDFFGLSVEDVRRRFPHALQRLLETAKPERDQNPRRSRRENWWIFGENQPLMRKSIVDLRRYIATGHVAKHRVFQFLDADILPDDKLIAIALDDASFLAILSSRVHVAWALATGGTLEDRPVYSKSTSFDRFPFPEPDEAARLRLRVLGEELDAHRKARQAAQGDLTITGMYNVLEKLRGGDTLDAKERRIHEDGLVSVLKSLHDEIDLATLDAYGWRDLAPLMQVVNGNAAAGSGGAPATREACIHALDDAILVRLVALNAVRAAEESAGQVRWLRPGFQRPQGTPAPAPRQERLEVDAEAEAAAAVPAANRRPWPRDLAEQIRVVAEALAESPGIQTVESLGGRFTGRGPWKRRLPVLLDSLVAVGRARAVDRGFVRVED
jgi:hypothetical protein